MQPFQQFREAINRPDDVAGWGYDDDYVKNPYHVILRKHGFEYQMSVPTMGGVSHAYILAPNSVNADVCGIYWTLFLPSGIKQGGHPNTKRAGADLERELVGAGL
jgi:hypothetical protein